MKRTKMEADKALETTKELIAKKLKPEIADGTDAGYEVSEHSITEGDNQVQLFDHPGIELIQIRGKGTFYNFDADDCENDQEKEIRKLVKGYFNV